jgi:hypothetical protein
MVKVRGHTMATEKVLSADYAPRLPYHVTSVMANLSARTRQLAQGADGCQAENEASIKLIEINTRIPFCLRRADAFVSWESQGS